MHINVWNTSMQISTVHSSSIQLLCDTYMFNTFFSQLILTLQVPATYVYMYTGPYVDSSGVIPPAAIVLTTKLDNIS